ncbi:MAG: hypothetical protein NVS1B7_6420 [Candidatus Saccharimonadales bacterium]
MLKFPGRERNPWRRLLLIVLALMLLITGSMYGIAQWYIFSQRHKSIRLGATFIADYATYLGVEPHETLYAIIHDLGAKQLRLVSYWDDIEKTPGTYDFNNLDWQIRMAEDAHVKVSLALGLRQPRWPECHMPTWAAQEPKSQWQPQLESFMAQVIHRYQGSPALDSYQLENEFFLSVFGICPDFSRDRLIEEAQLVKRLDSKHTLIISRSNNAVGFPLGEPQPDEFGVSVYKRVWDRTITKRYLEYPFPAWFYGFLAGGGKILTGKDLIIHELQAEAWTPDGYNIKDAPIRELDKSMNPARLRRRFAYAEASGIKSIDAWGVEWWYQMKVNRNQPQLWETAKQEFARTNYTSVE